MKTKSFFALILFMTGVLLLRFQAPAAASPDRQAAYPSPTPGPDGRIIYIVKAGETCTQISLLYGVSVEYIRKTNLLDENCSLREGQQLLIGVGGPSSASPTPGPSPTPMPILPTSTPGAGGTASICVLVYNDVNGDALRQEIETAIPGAALSLTNADGTFSQTLTTSINPDPEAYQGVCYDNVPPGQYTVSAAAPDGYNATIKLTTIVDVVPGDTAYVDYGAQARAVSETNIPQKKTSPLLGILGGMFLLGGIGLGIYAWRIMRQK